MRRSAVRLRLAPPFLQTCGKSPSDVELDNLMSGRLAGIFLVWFLVFSWSLGEAMGQTSLNVSGSSFQGTIHDNLSNKSRHGSGFTPLLLKTHPGANLFRDDAVGINFEHIF